MTQAAGRAPAWLAPQVLIALLLLLAALVYALRAPSAPAPPPTVALQPADVEPLPLVEVDLVLAEPGELERVVFVPARLPEDPAGRLEAIFAALRTELVDARVWPEEVPAPTVFLQRIDGSDIAVLDFMVPDGATRDVEAELRLVRSVEATADRHGAEVRYLVNGGGRATLLGHVGVPSSLGAD